MPHRAQAEGASLNRRRDEGISFLLKKRKTENMYVDLSFINELEESIVRNGGERCRYKRSKYWDSN